MDRRAFIGALAGGLLAAPLAAEAQPSGKVWRIGSLETYPPSPQGGTWKSFVQSLRDHGYIEGQNLLIERRFSEGRAERLPILAAELVQLRVSVIFTNGLGPTRAAKEATATISIVFLGVGDPVGLGLVASLARPGGNVTGLASIEWEAFTAKQLQVIKEALPKASRVAILTNPTNPMHARTLPQEQAAAERLGVKVQLVEAGNVDDLERAFAAAKREQADLVHVYGDTFLAAQQARVVELAMKYKLPTMHLSRGAVEAGGLLGLGPDWLLLNRNAGTYVAKILKGARPADLPVAQPTTYELVINLKTAKARGLTIPPALLQRADQVSE